VVNYGSNLILRCFVSSNRGLEDAIVLGVLVRQSIAMFDAIEILISNAAVYPCHMQIRAIFEVSLYLEWILQNDTKKRAKYFYVANVRQSEFGLREPKPVPLKLNHTRKSWSRWAICSPKPQNNLQLKVMNTSPEIDRILAQASFEDIDKDIETYRAKRKATHDLPWYVPLGPRSVRQLAKDLNRLHEYESIYWQSSEVMHSTSHKHHVKFPRGNIHFTAIRCLEGIDTILKFSLAIMLKIYKNVLAHYSEGELPNFGKKFLGDWQQVFMGIKSVTYVQKRS